MTAATPLQQYLVQSEGRTFVWSASSMEDLNRQLSERGHRATNVQLYSEYEAECAKIEGQQELAHEHNEIGGAAWTENRYLRWNLDMS